MPWTTLSERALIYTEESFVHRMLVLYEAHAGDNAMVTLLLRCILSEHHIRHETVDTSRGSRARSIYKPGPTRLLLTTTATLLRPGLLQFTRLSESASVAGLPTNLHKVPDLAASGVR